MSTATEVDDTKVARFRSILLSREGSLVASFAVGACLAAVAEHLASDGDKSWHFLVFWFGYAFVLIPTSLFVLNRATSETKLSAVVVGLGVWEMIPKLLRTGHQILYFDEFNHFRMLQDLAHSGHPVSEYGLLQIGASFPGLELFTSASSTLTGVSLLNAALAVTIVVHVTTLLGMFVLVKELSGKARAGALAAIIYSLNPSWLFFDSQFSYEGLAIAVLLWALIYAQRALSKRSDRRAAKSSFVLSVFLSFALVSVHHVTSLALCLILLLLAIIVTFRRRRSTGSPIESVPTIWTIALLAIAASLWRLLGVGHVLISYLAPSFQFSAAFKQLLSLIGLASGTPARQTLSGGIPVYEVFCAYLMIPVLLVAFVWAVAGLYQKRSSLASLVNVLAVAGLCFFASLPLVPVRQFSESVHRSWAFSFIGIAAVVAIAVVRHRDGELSISFRHRSIWPRPNLKGRTMSVMAVAAMIVVAVGGIATSTSVQYRFGSPVEPGTDAAAYGTQTTMVANWFAQHTSSHDVVFADRNTVRAIVIRSRVQVPRIESLYELTFNRHLTDGVLQELITNHVTYIVVDRRMSSVVPGNGFWYGEFEPDAFSKKLVPQQNLDRYGCLLWLNTTFATSDYEVFRVNIALLTTDIAHGSAGISATCAARGIT